MASAAMRLAFERQIRNGLTQIAVVVNDLIDRKTLLQQLAPVQRSGAAQLRLPGPAATSRTGNFAAAQGLGGLLNFEGLDQLIQKQRNSVRDFCRGHPGCRPSSHLETAAFYQISTVAGKKLVKHPTSVRWTLS